MCVRFYAWSGKKKAVFWEMEYIHCKISYGLMPYGNMVIKKSIFKTMLLFLLPFLLFLFMKDGLYNWICWWNQLRWFLSMFFDAQSLKIQLMFHKHGARYRAWMHDLDLGSSSGSLLSLFLGSPWVASLNVTGILNKDLSFLWEFQIPKWMDGSRETDSNL